MLICEALKVLNHQAPKIDGCEIGEFLPSPQHQHINLAPVQYNFVIAVETNEVAMNDNAGVERVIRERIALQLRCMLEELEKL